MTAEPQATGGTVVVSAWEAQSPARAELPPGVRPAVRGAHGARHARTAPGARRIHAQRSNTRVR
ncbi:hypothetical protein, partial [Streptomyces griseiscabiei]|uniref:hypothetical protein n=1 Tax=Streptomyces griseiscabiei TaxID=2993540 RepID=UPI001C4F4332